MHSTPQKEHQWLEQLVGDWIITSEGPGPDGETQSVEWTESVRSLHGIWVVAEGGGEMPDGSVGTMIMTLGYDPARQRYVGTWIGSMMTHLWVYEGTLDDTGKVLTLDTEGPDFATEGKTGGKLARYRDIITIEDADNRVLSAEMLAEHGSWNPIMSARYRRKR